MVLWKIVDFLNPISVVVRCVHVAANEVERDDSKLEEFANFISSKTNSIQTIFKTEVSVDIEAVLIEYAEMYNLKMIAMSRTHRSILDRILEKSHTKKLISKLNLPLLVYNY